MIKPGDVVIITCECNGGKHYGLLGQVITEKFWHGLYSGFCYRILLHDDAPKSLFSDMHNNLVWGDFNEYEIKKIGVL